jgi:hypothetical protein
VRGPAGADDVGVFGADELGPDPLGVDADGGLGWCVEGGARCGELLAVHDANVSTAAAASARPITRGMAALRAGADPRRRGRR